MKLNDAFHEWCKQNQYWTQDSSLLLAVSGGVDSMVLLDLFLQLPKTMQPTIGVAHVNHQLREESDEEANFLQAYCEKEQVPYYSYVWEKGKEIQQNIESEARDARYTFFSQTCQREHYDGVVTAHHGDDQAETFLMKLTTGTQLKNLTGIQPFSHLYGIAVYRPLLPFSKEEIRDYARARQLPYYEDATNYSDKYFRNRIRHQVIPLLKEENENFLKHIHSLVKQINYTNAMIEDRVREKSPLVIQQQGEKCWLLDIDQFLKENESMQYMLLVYWWQEVLVERGVRVNEEQLADVLKLLRSNTAQGEIHLAQGWRMEKVYREAFLQQDKNNVLFDETQMFQLNVGDNFYLNDREWIGLFSENQMEKLPEALKQWQMHEVRLANDTKFPLHVRHRQEGDRIIFNNKQQRKKINRVFIDEKIPNEIREETWLVTDSNQEILWIVPFRKSYLSIAGETDKIQYRLIYYKR